MARSLQDKAALVRSARLEALLRLGRGDRAGAHRLLVAMDDATRDPDPLFREFLALQIRRVERAFRAVPVTAAPATREAAHAL
jgi:hypothetical protein